MSAGEKKFEISDFLKKKQLLLIQTKEGSDEEPEEMDEEQIEEPKLRVQPKQIEDTRSRRLRKKKADLAKNQAEKKPKNMLFLTKKTSKEEEEQRLVDMGINNAIKTQDFKNQKELDLEKKKRVAFGQGALESHLLAGEGGEGDDLSKNSDDGDGKWIKKSDQIAEFIAPIEIPFDEEVEEDEDDKEGDNEAKMAEEAAELAKPVEIQGEKELQDTSKTFSGVFLEAGEDHEDRNKVNLLTLPPGAFKTDFNFLDDLEIDEQEFESIDNINYNDKNSLFRHLTDMQYDTIGYPLIRTQVEIAEGEHRPLKGDSALNAKVGKLKAYKSGRVVLELKGGQFEVISGIQSKFRQRVFSFDDQKLEVRNLGATGTSFVCIKDD